MDEKLPGGETAGPPEADDRDNPSEGPSSTGLARLRAVHDRDVLESEDGEVALVRVVPARIADVCRFLKEDPECRFTHLSNLSGVDMIYLDRPEPRFDVVYHLYSLSMGERMTLKAAVAEDGSLQTVTTVWRTANWHEREAYDMFGIRFEGHPDLRRILMPDEFDAYPLRKDFPLEGREKDHGYWRKPEDIASREGR